VRDLTLNYAQYVW